MGDISKRPPVLGGTLFLGQSSGPLPPYTPQGLVGPAIELGTYTGVGPDPTHAPPSSAALTARTVCRGHRRGGTECVDGTYGRREGDHHPIRRHHRHRR